MAMQTHYYPSYKNAALRIQSSLQWLERDLTLANNANLTSILLVHSAGGLRNNHPLHAIIRDKNIRAIFAGHEHRCLFKKCSGLYYLDIDEANRTTYAPPGTQLSTAKKCVPGSVGLCGGNVAYNSMNLFYVENVDIQGSANENMTLPETQLFSPPIDIDGVCGNPTPIYVNETDNTLLCVELEIVEPNYPFSELRDAYVADDAQTSPKQESEKEEEEPSIPIFWSGSASFETLLKADFYNDRFVENVLAAEAGVEGLRYVDTHTVPNAVYPHHTVDDLEEVIIYL